MLTSKCTSSLAGGDGWARRLYPSPLHLEFEHGADEITVVSAGNAVFDVDANGAKAGAPILASWAGNCAGHADSGLLRVGRCEDLPDRPLDAR